VCDDWIDVPLGILTLSGMCAAYLLVYGAVADKKLLVHPESSIALSSVVDVNMVGVQSKVNSNLSSLGSITLAAPLHNYFPQTTPPMVLSFVAISWCPSFLALQVVIVWSL
jgi:hypothetical protein